MKTWILQRLAEPSSAAGLAGVLSGIGMIVEGKVNTGLATLLAGLLAILVAEKPAG